MSDSDDYSEEEQELLTTSETTAERPERLQLVPQPPAQPPSHGAGVTPRSQQNSVADEPLMTEEGEAERQDMQDDQDSEADVEIYQSKDEHSVVQDSNELYNDKPKAPDYRQYSEPDDNKPKSPGNRQNSADNNKAESPGYRQYSKHHPSTGHVDKDTKNLMAAWYGDGDGDLCPQPVKTPSRRNIHCAVPQPCEEMFEDTTGRGRLSYRERPTPSSSDETIVRRHQHRRSGGSRASLHRPSSANYRRPRVVRCASRPSSARPCSASARRRKQQRHLDRLAQPKPDFKNGVSSVISDCENCTFKPKISKFAAKHAAGTFMQRLPNSTKLFMKKKNAGDRTAENFSFRPQLATKKKTAKKLTLEQRMNNQAQFYNRVQADIKRRNMHLEKARAGPPQPKITPEQREKAAKRTEEFFSRMHSDLRQRRTNQAKEPTIDFPFKPVVLQSPKGVELNGDFYERMSTDIINRERKLQEMAESQKLNFPFKKKSSNQQKKLDQKLAGDSFLVRYTEDMEKRKHKIDKLRRAFEARETHSFAPEISHYAKKNTRSGSFMSRMEADLDERIANKEEIDRSHRKGLYLK